MPRKTKMFFSRFKPTYTDVIIVFLNSANHHNQNSIIFQKFPNWGKKYFQILFIPKLLSCTW